MNDAPVIATLPDQASPEDQLITITAGDFAAQIGAFISDVDDANPTLSYSFVVRDGATIIHTHSFTGVPVGTSFTPPLNFDGALTVDVTVTDPAGATATSSFTLDVTPVNDLPLAGSPNTASGAEDTVITGSVPLGSDVETVPGALTYQLVAPVAGLVFNPNGTFAYTPAANANGAVSFQYRVVDGDGGVSTAATTFTINVTPVNDAPIAGADAASTAEDTPVTITVLTNDDDGDPELTQTLTVTGASAGHGSITVNGSNQLVYTPDANFNGADTISYVLSDGTTTTTGTVSVTVNPGNDAPVALNGSASGTEDNPIVVDVSALISDVDGNTLTVTSATSPNGSVSINGTKLTFAPTANFNGSTSISYTVNDGSGAPNATASASIAITVAAVNDAPSFTAGATASFALNEGETTGYDVGTVGATDVDDVALSYAILSGNNAGLFAINSSGLIELARPADDAEIGNYQLAVRVTDAAGAEDEITVSVAVNSVNDAPVNTVPGPQSVNEDANLIIAGLAISDVDAASGTLSTTLSVANGALTVVAVGGAAVSGSGTGSVVVTGTVAQINATLTAANNVNYQANSNFNGPDTLTITTNDNGNTGSGGAKSDTDTVAITVTSVNDSPGGAIASGSISLPGKPNADSDCANADRLRSRQRQLHRRAGRDFRQLPGRTGRARLHQPERHHRELQRDDRRVDPERHVECRELSGCLGVGDVLQQQRQPVDRSTHGQLSGQRRLGP